MSEAGPVRGAILAGGGATRFGGRPKGLEIVGGERILDRVAEVLASALGMPPILIANAPDAGSWPPTKARSSCPGSRRCLASPAIPHPR